MALKFWGLGREWEMAETTPLNLWKKRRKACCAGLDFQIWIRERGGGYEYGGSEGGGACKSWLPPGGGGRGSGGGAFPLLANWPLGFWEG